MSEKKIDDIEERYVSLIHQLGINLGAFVMATASVLAFILAFIRLIGALIVFLNVNTSFTRAALVFLGIERKPLELMLVEIVDASLLAAILLTFAFGLKSVYTGRQYRVMALDIRDINELKEYLVGLIITIIGTRFLERILRGGIDREILSIGIGLGAVIIALAIYNFILKQHKEPRK